MIRRLSKLPPPAPQWLVALGMGLLLCCGCAEEGAPAGSQCTAATQCASNFCYANLCLEPAGDDDGDGVLNKHEHQAGAHPLLGDSDGDGKPDGLEWGKGSAALDGDGDGKPDIVESALADRDDDCVPDERDAQDQSPLGDLQKLSELVCSHTGVCAKVGAVITAACAKGSLSCNYSAVPGWQAAEACDGVDNDCDGQTDEGFVYQGAAIGQTCSGVGECGKGVVVCATGKATCSTNPDGSQPRVSAEACNGKDDDCDGDTDEDFGLGPLTVGAPCLGKGECGIGVVMCLNSAPICSADPAGPHSKAAAETCNARDDDCDGQTDEGLSLQGQPLGAACAQLGICGTGVVSCGAQGWPVCSTSPGQPDSPATAESCNGIDDDCNGLTDEGFSWKGATLGSPCTGAGNCGKGAVTCSKAGVATCSTLPDGPFSQAGPELCNGLDDDCDGKTDEQLQWGGLELGASCDGTGPCGPGKVVCGAGGVVTCSTNPDGPASQAKPEQCNSEDDDCDGQTDESVAVPATVPCAAPGVCAALAPAVDCKSGQWSCDYSGQPSYQAVEQSCDGQDNDCDGATDEGLAIEWTATTAWSDGRPVARRQFASAADSWGRGYLAGGLVPTLNGAEVMSDELWRLDSTSGTWQRLASHPALQRSRGAMLVLGGPGGATSQVALVGGIGPDGKPAGSDLLDFSAAPAVTALPAPPTPVVDAAAVQSVGEWWLFGTRLDGQGGAVQRFDVQSNTWIGSWPQPPGSPWSYAACEGAGVLYALAVDTKGESSLSAISPGAAGWQLLAAPPAVATPLTAPGRLVYLASAGELWWLGAATAQGPTAPLRYQIAKKKWQSGVEPGAPALIEPLALSSGQGLVLAMGRDSDGLPQTQAWLRSATGWQDLDAEPETAVAATWLAVPGGAVRMGGFEPRGPKLVANRNAWRYLASSGWKRVPLPSEALGRGLAAAVLGPGGKQVLYWGGSSTLEPSQLLSPGNLLPAVQTLALDWLTGQWSSASSAVQLQLPSVQADSTVAATLDPGLWYGFSPFGLSGGAALWRLDWNKGKSNVWTSQQGPGPKWQPGTALGFDAQANRLLAAQVSGGLKLWVLQFGPDGDWSLAHSDPSVPDGRAVWIGGPGLKDRLLAILPPPGKGPPLLRLVKLSGGSLEVQPWTGTAPPWLGLVSLAWIGDSAWADGSLTSDGRYRSGIERVHRVCPKNP